ncbi:MAG: hypothetical protein Udaeo2_30680 [Candidatus Udaeobacter sp.]|nr:MAG: hypothetical protein Udaeo2_30680 [Candidatus Udaeobacter sp.]
MMDIQGRLRWGDAVKNVSGYSAAGNYFDLLGVQPAVGRFFPRCGCARRIQRLIWC